MLGGIIGVVVLMHFSVLICQYTGSYAFLFLPCLFGYMALSILFIFESWLIYIDVTSVEFLRGLMKGKLIVRRQIQAHPPVQLHDSLSSSDSAEYMESQQAIQRRSIQCKKSFKALLGEGQKWWEYLVPYPVWRIRQSNRKHIAVD